MASVSETEVPLDTWFQVVIFPESKQELLAQTPLYQAHPSTARRHAAPYRPRAGKARRRRRGPVSPDDRQDPERQRSCHLNETLENLSSGVWIRLDQSGDCGLLWRHAGSARRRRSVDRGRVCGRPCARTDHAVDWMRDGAERRDRAAAPRLSTSCCWTWACPAAMASKCCEACAGEEDRTPVIIITARDDVSDRIEGLDAGADDYIVKPFDLDELAARMRSVRAGALPAARSRIIEHNGIRLNPATRNGRAGRSRVPLSAHEYAVLEALMQRPGAVLSTGAARRSPLRMEGRDRKQCG